MQHCMLQWLAMDFQECRDSSNGLQIKLSSASFGTMLEKIANIAKSGICCNVSQFNMFTKGWVSTTILLHVKVHVLWLHGEALFFVWWVWSLFCGRIFCGCPHLWEEKSVGEEKNEGWEEESVRWEERWVGRKKLWEEGLVGKKIPTIRSSHQSFLPHFLPPIPHFPPPTPHFYHHEENHR